MEFIALIFFIIFVTLSWYFIFVGLFFNRRRVMMNKINDLQIMLGLGARSMEQTNNLKIIEIASSTAKPAKWLGSSLNILRFLKNDRVGRRIDGRILLIIVITVIAIYLSFQAWTGSILLISLPPLLLYFYYRRKSNEKKKQIKEQFPAFLETIARGINAGMTVESALRFYSKGMTGELSNEIKVLCDDLYIGTLFATALEDFSNKINILEGFYFVALLKVQVSSGGRLAASLLDLSKLLKQKAEAERRLNALNSQSKGAFQIMTIFPILALCYQLYVDMTPWSFLVEKQSGVIFLIILVAWHLLGVFIMRRITNVKL